jgi:catechol-2,3-dioxygenase
MLPELDGIDHIHVYVSNREKAADWYEDVLGFRVSAPLAVWARNEQGPLTIEDQSGKIHLALFKSNDFIPSTAIAFKTNAIEFLKWKLHLEKENILIRCTDHKIAWSVYFNDLDGNMHEITTYEYDHVTSSIDNSSA